VTSPTRGDGRGTVAVRAEALGERLGRSLAGLRQRARASGMRDDEAQDRGAPPLDETREAGAAPAGDGERFQRADQLVTRLQGGAVAYAIVLGQRLRRLAARLREEAEDIAAEAQHIRTDRTSGRTPATTVVDETKHSAA
jgi:hypothetical protein